MSAFIPKSDTGTISLKLNIRALLETGLLCSPYPGATLRNIPKDSASL